MPAPKPATEHLAEMLQRHQAKLIRLRKRRDNAYSIYHRLNEDVVKQEQTVDSLNDTFAAISKISVVRKAAEEVTP